MEFYLMGINLKKTWRQFRLFIRFISFFKSLKESKMSWEFWRSGTFWTALAGLVTAIGAFIGGQIDLMTLFAAIYALITTIFIRKAMHKMGAMAAGKKGK